MEKRFFKRDHSVEFYVGDDALYWENIQKKGFALLIWFALDGSGGNTGYSFAVDGSDINWNLTFPKGLALTSELESNFLLCAPRKQSGYYSLRTRYYSELGSVFVCCLFFLMKLSTLGEGHALCLLDHSQSWKCSVPCRKYWSMFVNWLVGFFFFHWTYPQEGAKPRVRKPSGKACLKEHCLPVIA